MSRRKSFTLPTCLSKLFFSVLNKHSRLTKLLDIFKLGQPNKNHFFIAKLIKYRLVKTVITTNFTTLIEQALINEGLVEGADFYVLRNEEEFELFDLESNMPMIIKIHGCITVSDGLVITIDKVAKRISYLARDRVIQHITSSHKYSSILVLGYSCSDTFDLTPMFKSKGTEYHIFHIDHQIEVNSSIEAVSSINTINNPLCI